MTTSNLLVPAVHQCMRMHSRPGIRLALHLPQGRAISLHGPRCSLHGVPALCVLLFKSVTPGSAQAWEQLPDSPARDGMPRLGTPLGNPLDERVEVRFGAIKPADEACPPTAGLQPHALNLWHSTLNRV